MNAAAAGETWSARLYYYADDDSSDNIAAGRYKSIDLSSTKTVDELAAKMNAGNPVVYDAPAGGQDLYLFDRPPAQPGYLESWLSVIGNFGTVDSTGRVTAAALDGAIRIETAPLNPVSADSKISLQVVGLSCRAVDKR